MLRSILLTTFRAHSRAALAWGVALALFTVFSMWTNWRNEYPTEEARQRLAQQVESGAFAFTKVLFGPAHHIDQFDGHAEWRLGLDPLLLGLFMVLATTASTRGMEERGELDLPITIPRSRRRLLAEQGAGLLLALGMACALLWFGLIASGPVAQEPILPPGRSVLAVLNLALAAAMFAAFSLLISQFFRTRRGAATAAGAVLFGAHFWANLGLVSESLEGWRWLSPLYLYAQSTPLATGHVSVAAIGAAVLITLACVIVSAWMFDRRDLQTAVHIPLQRVLGNRFSLERHSGGGLWFLGNGFQRAFRASIGTAFVWGLGLALVAALVTAATPSIRSGFAEQPEVQDYVERLEFDITSDGGVLSTLLFLLLPLLVAIFAAVLAGAFASEEEAGRLELELTLPVTRRRYFFERARAALLACAVTVSITAVGFLAAARLINIELDWDKALATLALLILPAAVVVSFGQAVGAFKPAAVGGVLAAALAGSFFFDLLAPALDLPAEVRKLSIFQLYGRPLLEGVHWLDVAIMVTLILAFQVVGAAVFTRRDILK